MGQMKRSLAKEQDEGETCLLCGVEIHEVEQLDRNGYPEGQTALVCHGMCPVMEQGGR